MGAPVPILAAAWLIGALLGSLVLEGAGARWLALSSLVIGLVAAGSASLGSARLRAKPWIAILAAGAAMAGASTGRARSPPPVIPDGVARIEARVEEVEHGASDRASIVRVLGGTRIEDAAPIARDTRLRVRSVALEADAVVRCLVRVRPRIEMRNPTPHPRWPAVDPVHGEADLVARARVIAPGGWRGALEAARSRVRDALERTLPPRAAAVARALVLGDGRALSLEDARALRGSGLAHVLAVSGLHVTLLCGLAVWLFEIVALRVRALAERVEARRVACALGVPLALVYAAFAGGAPSAWRAAVTASIAWTLIAMGRRPDAVAVAGAAAIVIGAISPDDALRPAYLLSVVATAAIVSMNGVRRARTIGEIVRDACVVSARTAIATAPLVIWCFGGAPIVGPIANLVLVPIGSLVLLPLAALHALFATLAAPLAELTGPILDAVARAFLAGCDAASAVRWGQSLPPPSIAQGIALAIASATLLLVRSWRVRITAIGVTMVALCALEAHLRWTEQPTGVVRATFVDVGQGDAALVDLPDGRFMLVDAGGTIRGVDPGRATLVPLLAARRRERIDVVVLTHPHPDHYRGLPAVLERVRATEIWDSGQAQDEAPNGEVARLLRSARKRGARVRGPPELCGRPRWFGAARVDVVWPCPRFDAGYDANDNSIVVRIALGGRALLLAGDAEEHAEGAIAVRGGVRADVLKAGHHGSRTSSTSVFLARVAPQIAIVSAGLANRFGHPHPEALARLASAHVRVLRTDREGGIVVEMTRAELRVRTWRGTRAMISGR